MCYTAKDGIVYSKDMRTLIYCPRGKKGIVDVPEGVESVMENAFSGCRGITAINLPSSLKDAPADALSLIESGYARASSSSFSNSQSKRIVVNVEEGTTSIDRFYDETLAHAEVVNLPASLVHLDIQMFQDNPCSSYPERPREINIAEGNFLYTSKDGIIYSKDMSTLIFCPKGKAGQTVVIPNGVTRLAEGSFGATKLRRLVIPASVTCIDKGAIMTDAPYGARGMFQPDSAEQPGEFPFPIHVQEGNPVYQSKDGRLSRKDGGSL